ncbi:MAG TPA: hypothetical protein EYN36_01090 [Pelagibacteraceae bacterium]|nr:hypothetical protein [Pelagibacteraceae bacterium]
MFFVYFFSKLFSIFFSIFYIFSIFFRLYLSAPFFFLKFKLVFLIFFFVNGESLSSFLVRHGYAFAYRKYSKKFVKDEEYAKKIRIGMWAMKFEFPWDFRKNKIADNPSKRCGVELTAKLEGYMVWLTEELPHIEPAINLNCKIQIMNLKELTEKDKEKLKRHEIELSDENNKIV